MRGTLRTLYASVVRLDIRLFDLPILNDESVAFAAVTSEDSLPVKREVQSVGE